eukprot:m.11711 g.11711  ORF g.11711 m.11711 type:complete len:355 (+) comp8939_c0_seq1:193-1257(+)
MSDVAPEDPDGVPPARQPSKPQPRKPAPRKPPKMPVTSAAMFRVIQDFEPTEAEHLQLKTGEMIQVTMKGRKDEMWTGTSNFVTGTFPGTCVELVKGVSQPITQQPKETGNIKFNNHGEAALHSHDYRALLAKLNTLPLDQVLTWTPQDVVDKFLTLINLEMYGQVFVDQKINGSVLLTLTRTDLRFMKKEISMGDRVIISDAAQYLAKEKLFYDAARIAWKGSFPTGSMQYYKSCYQFTVYRCCPCFADLTHFRLTPRYFSVTYDRSRANFCCTGKRTDYHNLSFLKDVDWQKKYCCFCYTYNELRLIFEYIDKGKNDEDWIQIAHPSVGDELVKQIEFFWSEAVLVAESSSD